MIWIKKTFPLAGRGWSDDLDRFGAIQLSVAADGTDAYRRLMMVSVREDELADTEDIFIRLPDHYARLFSGYERVDAGPETATMFLGGDQLEYDRYFGDA